MLLCVCVGVCFVYIVCSSLSFVCWLMVCVVCLLYVVRAGVACCVLFCVCVVNCFVFFF